MLWTFLASFVVLAAFMLILALGMICGRRKRECSCKAAARVMATKSPLRREDSDSPFKILDNNGDGCQCGNE